MRANLVKKWKRGESVRVRNLTEAQIDHIYWANALYCEGAGIPEEVCEYGKTYVEAPVDICPRGNALKVRTPMLISTRWNSTMKRRMHICTQAG